MKKLFLLLALVGVMVACGGGSSSDSGANYETQITENYDALLKAIQADDYDAFAKAMKTYDKLYPNSEEQKEVYEPTYEKWCEQNPAWEDVYDTYYEWANKYRGY